MNLKQQQQRLNLNIINYDLDKMWKGHSLINELRERIKQFFPTGLYDPQDLEHQTLFRLTTFDPKYITDDVIKEIIEEQYLIIEDRLKGVKKKWDLEYLFRGLSGKYNDLNINRRLKLHKDQNNRIFAKKESGVALEVFFKKVDNEEIISFFTNDLHYIHAGRTRGETFGLYFTYDQLPWAIETTEPSILAKDYKRKALIAHGIDPCRAIELTRLYTLPGSPTNAISILDGLISDYYRSKGIEAIYTTTMPMYSKTKGATISGGINNVLLIKNLRHKFIQVKINNKTYYQQATSTFIEENQTQDFLVSHTNFPLMYVVEVYRRLKKSSLEPLPILKTKAIYVPLSERDKDLTNNKIIEKEAKFAVNNIVTISEKLNIVANFINCVYIRDTIYNLDDARLRLRVKNDFKTVSVEVMFKHRICGDNGIKVEIEEIVYIGNNLKDAVHKIMSLGNFIEYNSYEKIRTNYSITNYEAHVTLDIYPYGAWVEIEAEENIIWKIADQLGFKQKDAIEKNADELYEEWCQKNNTDVLWDIRFGFPFIENNIYKKVGSDVMTKRTKK